MQVTLKSVPTYVGIPTFELASIADRRVRFIEHCKRMSMPTLKKRFERELEAIKAELAKRP